MASNPEFLKEGAAVDDFMKPDRIVIGADDERAIAALRTVYAPFMRNHERLLVMDVRSAELTKYAANAMLATRISFMNEVANLADLLGADIEMVRQGIGSDPRIGYHFLYPGAGYGGSCFPEGREGAAVHRHAARPAAARARGRRGRSTTRRSRCWSTRSSAASATIFPGARFALWGLAFKPNTDDMREAPSRVIVEALLARGATHRRLRSGRDGRGAPRVRTARRQCPMRRRRWPPATAPTRWSSSPNGRSSAAPDFDVIKARLKSPLIFDGRNLYDPAHVRAAGIEYFAIGRR